VNTKLEFAPGEKPDLCYCESIYASSFSRWHLRRPKTGLKLGGGIDSPSLCGRIERGWDLNVRPDASHDPHTCQECLVASKAATR